MKFKIGDKVKVMGSDKIYEIENITQWDKDTQRYKFVGVSGWHVVDTELADDPLAKKIEERNNKPIPTMQSDPEELEKQLREVFPEDDPIKPKHYENNGKDLFDELYDRLYHSKKMFTGREVFIIVMKFVAERYTRRYPNKNPEDLGKGIYTLERLKEYEEMEQCRGKNCLS